MKHVPMCFGCMYRVLLSQFRGVYPYLPVCRISSRKSVSSVLSGRSFFLSLIFDCFLSSTELLPSLSSYLSFLVIASRVFCSCLHVFVSARNYPETNLVDKKTSKLASGLHGDLTSWARQGVFLLNTLLTVRESSPLSHQSSVSTRKQAGR